jgi:type VI secretion system protein ImpG
VGVIRVDMKCTGGARLSALGLDKLRFHLSGESHVAHALYELLFTNVIRVVLRSTGKHAVTVDLPADALQAVGFGRD